MRKTMVRSSDYEFYRILLPWKSLFSRRKKLIVSELERRHPRFSLSCCYDTKYSVEKKNLMAEIVVMEKSSLARYKSAGGELYLEDFKKRFVFSEKRNFIRAMSLILIVLAGILSFRIAKSLFSSQKPVVENVVKEIKAEGLSTTSSEAENHSEDNEHMIDDVFASISSHCGKISSFSYAAKNSFGKNIGGGTCNFSIHGCNCEDVANARYCVVSFRDNEPCFDMVLPFSAGILLKKNKIPEEDDLKAVVEIRSLLRKIGATFESERNGIDTAEFSFYVKKEILYSCLKILGSVAENAQWFQKSISIDQSANLYKVKVCFDKESYPDSLNPLLLVAKYAYLFAPELKVEARKNHLFASKPENQKKLSDAKSKIGEIRKKDGSILICYRNSDGKMSFGKKEAVNAN